MQISTNNNQFLMGATLGCVVGAATALLFTPFSGKSLRKNLYHEMRKKQHQVNGYFHPHKSTKKSSKKPIMRAKKKVSKAARSMRAH